MGLNLLFHCCIRRRRSPLQQNQLLCRFSRLQSVAVSIKSRVSLRKSVYEGIFCGCGIANSTVLPRSRGRVSDRYFSTTYRVADRQHSILWPVLSSREYFLSINVTDSMMRSVYVPCTWYKSGSHNAVWLQKFLFEVHCRSQSILVYVEERYEKFSSDGTEWLSCHKEHLAESWQTMAYPSCHTLFLSFSPFSTPTSSFWAEVRNRTCLAAI